MSNETSRDFSWSLESPPAPATPDDSAELDPGLVGPLGRPLRGMLFPFRRSASDYATGTDKALLDSAIALVIGVTCSGALTDGELPWRTTFGSLVDLARHQNNEVVLAASVEQWVVDAITRWISDIRVTRVETEKKNDARGQPTMLVVTVFWEVVLGGRVVGDGSTTVPVPLSSSG